MYSINCAVETYFLIYIFYYNIKTFFNIITTILWHTLIVLVTLHYNTPSLFLYYIMTFDDLHTILFDMSSFMLYLREGVFKQKWERLQVGTSTAYFLYHIRCTSSCAQFSKWRRVKIYIFITAIWFCIPHCYHFNIILCMCLTLTKQFLQYLPCK